MEMINVENAFKKFLHAQEIERRESHTAYYSEQSELIFSISSIWEFMREVCVNAAFRNHWYDPPEFFEGLKDNSELQQESLLRLISAFVQDENIDKIRTTGKGQFWYLFANAVASFSNYNNYYWTSKEALKVLEQNGIDGSVPVSRSKVFQIRKDGKKLLVFEHMCPATQLIRLILEQKKFILKNHNKWSQLSLNDSIKRMIENLLHDYGLVAIVTKEEDLNLKGDWRNKLDFSEPDALSQMMYRYESAGIQLDKKLIPVYGKMYR